MLFAAEISYQCISIEDLQRALPGITVTDVDKRSLNDSNVARLFNDGAVERFEYPFD